MISGMYLVGLYAMISGMYLVLHVLVYYSTASSFLEIPYVIGIRCVYGMNINEYQTIPTEDKA